MRWRRRVRHHVHHLFHDLAAPLTLTIAQLFVLGPPLWLGRWHLHNAAPNPLTNENVSGKLVGCGIKPANRHACSRACFSCDRKIESDEMMRLVCRSVMSVRVYVMAEHPRLSNEACEAMQSN